MGGLAGHIMHLYENYNISFGELKEIFSLLANNKLSAEEKLDGQNMFFSYSTSANEIRFARNKQQMCSGGMARKDIEDKWAHLDNVRNAYLASYDILSKTIPCLKNKEEIFGDECRNWFSIEVIHDSNPNVIKYEKNCIKIHHGSFVMISGNVCKTFDEYVELMKQMPLLSSLFIEENWIVTDTIPVQFETDEFVKKHYKNINCFMKKYDLHNEDKIKDFVRKKFELSIDKKFDDTNVIKELGALFVDENLKPGEKKKVALDKHNEYSNEIKKHFSASNQRTLHRSLVKEIEEIIFLYSVDLLKNTGSSLIENHCSEIVRIKNALDEAIKENKTQNAIDIYKQCSLIENNSKFIEGIVFLYKNDSYKMTGVFGPINNLFGISRY